MIVQFDFDGTLAIGDNLSIINMHPNVDMVKLCNQLYDDGNKIEICTARGSKSCNSIEDRIEKYKRVIEDWLDFNGVKYHVLSFNKKYADIYIDDRAYNVDSSINYQLLDSGFTKNKVTRVNNKVIKVTDNALREKEWYNKAQSIGLFVPKIYHTDKDTISLEYIIGEHIVDAEKFINILNTFKNTLPTNKATYKEYIRRIYNHLYNNPHILSKTKILDLLNTLNIEPTFSHGDFSINNLINTGDAIYIIDPIYHTDVFQSYVIDMSKNLFSILFYQYDYAMYNKLAKMYCDAFNIDMNTLKILIASESIRVATHNKKYTDISNNLIDAL